MAAASPLLGGRAPLKRPRPGHRWGAALCALAALAVLSHRHTSSRTAADSLVAAVGGTSCVTLEETDCKTSSACQWRASDLTCIAEHSSDDDATATADDNATATADDNATATADDNTVGRTSCSALEETDCKTSSACQWRASDLTCIAEHSSDDNATATADDNATATADGNATGVVSNLTTNRHDNSTDDTSCSGFSARSRCERHSTCSWRAANATCATKVVETDDSTDDRTVNNTRLHIERVHHTVHHHGALVARPNVTWDDDDAAGFDDDDALHARRRSGRDVLNHSYCPGPGGTGATIGKNTQSSANATATFLFYVEFLGAFCQSREDCSIGCAACGRALRAALPRSDANLSWSDPFDRRFRRAPGANDYSCFGLHAVDARARPAGAVPFDDVVAYFGAQLRGLATYATPLLEHGTVLYADNADLYLARFAARGVPHLLGAWTSESGVPLYSVWTHVPHTVGVLEIVARHVHARFLAGGRAVALDGARLPDAAFALAGVNLTRDGRGHVLRPLAISKATSNMAEVERFYRRVLLADELHYREAANASFGRVFRLHEGNIAIRFVEARDDPAVAWIENVKKGAHNSSYVDFACGTDRYCESRGLRFPKPSAPAVPPSLLPSHRSHRLPSRRQPFLVLAAAQLGQHVDRSDRQPRAGLARALALRIPGRVLLGADGRRDLRRRQRERHRAHRRRRALAT